MKTRFLEAIATLIGATIGAGILGIPYVVYKAGILTGLLVILAIGAATLLINLYLGEVVLRTKGNHQLSGYAEKYTGKVGKNLASTFMIFGTYGALIAYTMGVGQSVTTIAGGNYFIYGLIFFAAASLIVLNGIKSLGKAELVITALLIGVVMFIPAFSAEKMMLNNFNGFDIYKVLIPYGVVLFAFMGSPAIPTMKEELNNNRKLLKKAIILGTLIPLVIYILFTVIVIGIVGAGFLQLEENQKIATVALSMFVRPEIGMLANIFAILTMSTSFLALSFALIETFKFDYKLDKRLAFAATLSIPLAVFVLNTLFFDATNFLNILAIVGSVTGGITGILIVIMHYKAKNKGDRKPEFTVNHSLLAGILLATIFVIGILNEIFNFF